MGLGGIARSAGAGGAGMARRSVLIGALPHSGRWRGWLAESTDQPHLMEGLDAVARRLGGLSRRWRFDRMSTVAQPRSRAAAGVSSGRSRGTTRSASMCARPITPGARARWKRRRDDHATLVAHPGRRGDPGPGPGRAGPAVCAPGRAHPPPWRDRDHGGGVGRGRGAATGTGALSGGAGGVAHDQQPGPDLV